MAQKIRFNAVDRNAVAVSVHDGDVVEGLAVAHLGGSFEPR